MIGLLQPGKGCNASSLAARCHVSRRTIFRDLDVLREAGVPLQYDSEFQTYHLADSYFLPPTNLTVNEALALIVLCHELGDVRQVPFLAPAQSAAIKLESTLPAGLRKQLRSVADAIRIRLPPASPVDGQAPIYDQLLDAIRARRSIRIEYDSFFDGQLIRTRLSPYRIMFSRHSWYAIGRSTIHRSVRTFNVGRIRRTEPTEERFNIPRNFSLDRYLGNAWHLIPEPGPDRDVRVRFGKRVARNVGEVAWHKTQRLAWNADGSLDYRVTVSGLNEISWWILGYGHEAQVLEPAELRKLVASHARRMLEHYGDGAAK